MARLRRVIPLRLVRHRRSDKNCCLFLPARDAYWYETYYIFDSPGRFSLHKIRVYVDTSVFGGTQDEEFAEASLRFFEQVRKGRFLVLVSRITLDELVDAPEMVRNCLADLPDRHIEEIPVNDDVNELARAYIDAGILGSSNMADAIHVAAATMARADLILSWNFRHIVNYDRIHKYNGVNSLKGYPPIEIHSPLEMSYDNEDQDI